MTESRIQTFRNYWLKIIRSALQAVKIYSAGCQYNLSFSERIIVIRALKNYREKFFSGDCGPLINELQSQKCKEEKIIKDNTNQINHLIVLNASDIKPEVMRDIRNSIQNDYSLLRNIPHMENKTVEDFLSNEIRIVVNQESIKQEILQA